MNSDPNVLQLLGRIDGKLDQVIATAEEHREDDTRRFTEVFNKLGEHDKEIAKAHGAKGVLLWVAGGVASVIALAVPYVAKALGLK